MTNKIPQITTLILATILIAGGFGVTQLAYSTGSNFGSSNSNNNNDNHNDDKIEICHIPPGNPNNPQTITIAKSAWAAHLSHGDHKDECDDDDHNGGGTPGKAMITLYKAITNDNGGTKGTSDFQVKVDTTLATLGTPMEITADQPHTISETQVPGYSFVLIAGDDRCPTLLNEPFTLKQGEKITCAIYNDDNANGENPGETTITLKKTVTNDNGGLLTEADFEITLDGTTEDQEEILTISPGPHIISEIPEEGYSAVLISGDGCPSQIDESFVVEEGDQIICTIYNDDNADDSAPIQPGVIFYFDTLQFKKADGTGIGCSITGPFPCIADVEGNFIIVPDIDPLDLDAQQLTDTTLILLTVLDTDITTNNPGCQVTGIDTEPSSGRQGFVMICPDLTGDVESDIFNVNFALIETSVT